MDTGETVNASIKESVDPSNRLEPRNRRLPRKKAVISKKLRCGLITSGVCLVIFIVVAAAMPIILDKVILSMAAEQAIMKPETEKMWSDVPGMSEAEFIREFSFFNFSNWQDFYFHGAKPQFTEIQHFKFIQEWQGLNIKYSENGEKVSMDSYLHFRNKQGARNPNQTIHVMNAGPLAFWYQVKTINMSQLFNQGMGLLFTNLEAIITNVVVSEGLTAQYLSNYSIVNKEVFEPADINEKLAKALWQDITFGVGTQDNLGYWINAAKDGLFSPAAQKLGVYFGLTTSQLSAVLDFFSDAIKSLESIVFDNYYCKDGSECSGFNLAARQMMTSEITNKTPPVKGILPTITLCENNATCEGGMPEISVYYEKVFRPNHPGPQFQNISFSPQLGLRWFKHSYPNLNKREDCLLHFGNLQALFNNGTLYDKTSDEQYLKNLQNRFTLPSREHTIVFWEWSKYYVNNFVIKRQLGGNQQKIGMCLVGAEWFWKSYSKTEDMLLNTLLQYKLVNMTSIQTCQKLINDSIANIGSGAIDKLCNSYNIRKPSDMQELIYVCMNKYGTQWKMFRDVGGLTDYQMETFCDKDNAGSFGQALDRSQLYIRNRYQCRMSPSGYCSAYELATKQWANSTVSLDPIPELPSDLFPKSTTVKSWFKAADVRAFEYGHYMSKYPNKTMQQFSQSEGSYMMNWNGIWSLFIMQRIMLANDTSQTPQQLGIKNLKDFQDYLRYLTVFVAFDGFVKERSAYELVFGYVDGFLNDLKENIDPCRGGDPSIPSLVHFNDLNISKQQAGNYPLQFWTGKNHPEKLCFFSRVNGQNWINFNWTKWNGNETYNVLKNPWAQQDILAGTNGMQSRSDQFANNNLTIYVPNLYRYGNGFWSGDTYEKFGLTIYKGTVSDELYKSAEQNPAFAKYYATFPGALNLTSLNGFPVFITKNHFLNASDNWTKLIDIWDENHTFIFTPNIYDDPYLHFQPYSGVTFSAVIFMQSNYYYEQDDLFLNPQRIMLPIFTINRGGNFSQKGVDNIFGELKMGLAVKNASRWVGLGMAILCAIILTILILRVRRIKKQEEAAKNSDLMISLQAAGPSEERA